MRGQNVPLFFKSADHAPDVLRFKAEVEHFPRRLRQFVRLVDNHGAVVGKNGAVAKAPPYGVRQKKVMVANLEKIRGRVAVVQKVKVLAPRPVALADAGNLQQLPVIASDVSGFVHVNLRQESPKPVLLFRRAFRHLFQSPLQLFVADVMAFALADDAQGVQVNFPAVLRQDFRQLRDVRFVKFGLEGDAGC